MRKDEFDIGAARGRVAGNQAHDGAGRICRILESLRDHALDLARAAGGLDRMNVDDRPTPVELIENRHERFVANELVVIAGPEGNAVGFESVERIFDFAQAAVDVR